jgi:hypothetical protein
LASVARDTRIKETHGAVLVFDGACRHTAKHLIVLDGIDCIFIPQASPERQLAE